MSLPQAFLLPLFLHFALTVYVGVRNILVRIRSVMSGETRLKDVALNSANWPPKVKKFGNNFDNQFDVPTVWYAVCALIAATAKLDQAFVAMNWLFVASRYVHFWIHTGSNDVRNRMFAFIAGFGALVTMWIWFAIRLFVTG